MLRYHPNWFARILRNTAEVVGDTVVIHEPAQIIEVPAAPGVGETLGAAAAVVDMAQQLAATAAPVDYSGEILSELRAMNSKLDTVIAAAAAAPAPVVVVTPEPEPPAPAPEPPEVNVVSGDMKKEEITEVIPANEAPKKRKRNWL